MIYNLKNQEEVNNLKDRITHLIEKTSVVELTEKRINRTLPQNNYLHLILTYFAVHFGYSLNETKDDFFKILCNKEIFIRSKFNDNIGEYLFLRSTSDLNTEEMRLAINRFKDWSANNGLVLPNSDDWHLLNHIRNLEESHKEWL